MIKNLVKKYKMHWISVSVYYLQANEMIKRSHKLIMDLVVKLLVMKRGN